MSLASELWFVGAILGSFVIWALGNIAADLQDAHKAQHSDDPPNASDALS